MQADIGKHSTLNKSQSNYWGNGTLDGLFFENSLDYHYYYYDNSNYYFVQNLSFKRMELL